jgi:hypothetical protein
MLPSAQKPHEIGGAHRLNLTAQASKRLPVNARKNTPVTKFVLAACEIAAEDLAFCLELSERNFDVAEGQSKPLR